MNKRTQLGLILLTIYALLNLQFAAKRNSVEIGVCTSLSNAKLLQDNGCTYMEESVGGFLVPTEHDSVFEKKLQQAKSLGLQVYACNSFIPATLKVTGPETKHKEILVFADTAFRRAKKAGVAIIVFGSGGARKIPDGFSKDSANQQFISLLKQMAPIAQKYGITVCIETLNKTETNFVNTITEGLEIVKAVDHQNIMLLADFYHIMKEGESPDVIIKAGKYIKHCHIAEKEKRTPPGIEGDDFKPYFEALKKINYKGKISIECRWTKIEEELPLAVKEMNKQMAEIE